MLVRRRCLPLSLLCPILSLALVACHQAPPSATVPDRAPIAVAASTPGAVLPAALAAAPKPTSAPTRAASNATPVPEVTQGPVSGRVDGPTSTPEPERPAFTIYTIKPGDTLGVVADRLGIPMSDLMKANLISDPNLIQAGQQLKVPAAVNLVGPADRLIPDSELVYGPTSTDFNVDQFASSQPGYLKDYKEVVEGRERTGPQIVQLVVQRYSVGPRLLLALLELKGGWLSNPSPQGKAKTYPLGKIDPIRPNLYHQLTWTADQLNEGYYGWKGRGKATLGFADGQRARINNTVNPGTIALQYVLAQEATPEELAGVVAKGGDFVQTYTRLFGDPIARAADPVVPPGTRQPELRLPWVGGEWWFLSGGPHGAWGDGSAWAALDFIPGRDNMGGCWDASNYWEEAAAPGIVVRSESGEVMLDLDGDGHETTGWDLLYMHVASEDRVPVGARLKTGDHIGHPSCAGGVSNGTHLHFARKYNGEWIPADGPIPFVLSGWVAHNDKKEEYDGTLTRGGETKESCECRSEAMNGLLSDNR